MKISPDAAALARMAKNFRGDDGKIDANEAQALVRTAMADGKLSNAERKTLKAVAAPPMFLGKTTTQEAKGVLNTALKADQDRRDVAALDQLRKDGFADDGTLSQKERVQLYMKAAKNGVSKAERSYLEKNGVINPQDYQKLAAGLQKAVKDGAISGAELHKLLKKVDRNNLSPEARSLLQQAVFSPKLTTEARQELALFLAPSTPRMPVLL